MATALRNCSAMLAYITTQVGLLVLVCVAEAFAQGAPRGPGASIQPGFMIVGPSAKRDFALRAGDTLPELNAAAVPKQVVRAADRQATEYHFSPACTRYFRTTGRYVALLVKSCNPDEVVEDGQGMAVYDASGKPAGQPTPWLSGHYVKVDPAVRAQH